MVVQRLGGGPAAGAARTGAALGLDGLRGGRGIAPAAAREEAHLRLGVVDQLGAQVAAHVAAAHVDRRGGAGVRGRHHGRDVGGLEQEEAGAGRARAARGDEGDDRHGRAELGLRDLAHRLQQAARRLELEHDGRVVGLGGAVDLVHDPVRRHGVDVGVEHHHSYMRGLGRGSRRQRETGDQCHGQKAQGAHRRPAAYTRPRCGRDATPAREARVVRLALKRSLPVAVALLLFAPAASAAGTRYGELSLAAPATPGTPCPAGAARAVRVRPAGRALAARAGSAVEVRTRANSAPWSAWTRLQADAGGAVSHAEPVWLPGSRLLQVRVRGAARVRIALVAADRSPLRPLRALASAPGQPSIISRAGWGADESIRRAAPRYAEAVHMVFVHHTDTPNGYAPDDVPRSSARSTPTTCARTAGTTLATTSSSTPTGASTRAAPAASTAR